MPTKAIAWSMITMMIPVAAMVALQQVRDEFFMRIMLASASPGRFYNFPGRGIQLHPRVFHARTTTTLCITRDDILYVAVKIDGCLVTTCRREILTPVCRKVATRDLVLSLMRRRIVQKIYRIRVRVGYSWWTTRFAMMIECWTRGLRNPFCRFSSFTICRSRHYITSILEVKKDVR